jgi:hypothetical protein
VLARYPLHWHLTSDTTQQGNFVRFSSIHSNFQRGLVIHQTNGLKVEDNVFYDTLGHAIYFEDGIEHNNVVERNLVMLVRYVPRRHRLSLKDPEKDRAEKLAGMWITNPANFIRGNVVAGVQNGWGYIVANVRDDKIPVIDPLDKNWVDNSSYVGFADNTAYAIGFLQGAPDGGPSVFNLGYGPEEAGSCFRFNKPGAYASSVQIKGLRAFKCANAASWSTNFLPLRGVVVADSRVAVVNDQGVRNRSELLDSAIVARTANNPPTRTDFSFGPFVGPLLKENLEAGPVSLVNVAVSGRFLPAVESLSAGLEAAAGAEAGFSIRPIETVALKADAAASVVVEVDRSGGYQGPVSMDLAIPKAPNMAEENPYHEVIAVGGLLIPSGATQGVLTLRNGAGARAGNSLATLVARGDATRVSTFGLLTSTRPITYQNAQHTNNVARSIPGDSPRNPQMSSIIQNAAGRFAVDGQAGTAARFDTDVAPWIRLDLARSYFVSRVVLDWDPDFAPEGDVALSLSEFDLLESELDLAAVRRLPATQATTIDAATAGHRMVIDLPAGTSAKQIKVWVVNRQSREVRLREVEVISP